MKFQKATYTIGIVVVAIQVEENIVEQFKTALAISTKVPYCLKIVSDDNYIKDGLLNKSQALNDGLREIVNQCEIIVCTDIDMLIPPGLIDYTLYCTKMDFNLWVMCRNLPAEKVSLRLWRDWLQRPLRMVGQGSWNAMLREDWVRSGGWDERLTGWGGEDYVFAMRRKQAGIEDITCTIFPLMHIDHPPRQNKTNFMKGNTDAVDLGMSGSQRNWLL